ncbi:MAG: galactose-1-phosphate uridylyltransferase [Deltaproteobacteria bacterium]|nr:galactose-1-phosphate uridylyltransferase [Deltaproteobacteria bacterium]
MPELRKDPIIGRWVIISTERGMRPTDFTMMEEKKKGGFCPFCPGNEGATPPEILCYRENSTKPNTPGWSLRVVANKFPALRVEGELNREGEGVYDRMNGIGAHEVIIESPYHSDTLSTISVKNFEDLLWAFRDRMIDLRKDARLKYVLIFKNQGESAGASLEHTHSQLIALPIVPKRVTEELEGAKAYYSYKERCIFCDIIRQETKQGSRVISENQDFIVIAPFAPRSPFETWILPKRHSCAFDDGQKHEFENLARIFSDTLKRLDKVLSTPPYNFILHTAPFSNGCGDSYHWHFEIVPKLVKIAGFEWGSGFYINPTPPEESARFMREVKL